MKISVGMGLARITPALSSQVLIMITFALINKKRAINPIFHAPTTKNPIPRDELGSSFAFINNDDMIR
jgi:hypothetical protein